MAKKKQNKSSSRLMGSVKETMGLGVASMGGMSAMGALGNVAVAQGVPHHQVSSLQTTTGAALGLANTGNLAKQAFVLVDVMDKSSPGKSKKQWAPVETKKSAKRRVRNSSNRTDFINTMMRF